MEPVRRLHGLEACINPVPGAESGRARLLPSLVLLERTLALPQPRCLEELQARVADGDRAAARQLCTRLAPAVAVMVRRALRFPADSSVLHEAVHAEVRRLGLTARGELLAEDRQMVRLIAGCLCARVIERLRFGSTRLPAGETVNDLADSAAEKPPR
jgi:hypothetical protein